MFIYDFHISNDLISTVILFSPKWIQWTVALWNSHLTFWNFQSSFQMSVYCGLNLRRKNLQKLNLFSVHYSLTGQNYHELGRKDGSMGNGLTEQAWHPEFGSRFSSICICSTRTTMWKVKTVDSEEASKPLKATTKNLSQKRWDPRKVIAPEAIL